MRHAINAALNGTGYVSPNPRVGAVIVRNGQVVSKGWHTRLGAPHAEIEAIRSAHGNTKGATMYVTLEPCAHQGRTPPCTPAIIEAGITRVVIGTKDPNPHVAGNGAHVLADAGVEVTMGVLEADCQWLIRFFEKHTNSSRPYVVAKVAQTLDGCTATASGQSKWITGEESRRRGHVLRAGIDAIMVGRLTVAKDDPELTTRSVAGRNPLRVVLDTNLSLGFGVKVFNDFQRHNTLVLCSEAMSSSVKARNLEIAGIRVAGVRPSPVKGLDLHHALELLATQYSISSVLVEGGATLMSSFMAQGLIDEMHTFVAPTIIGDGKHSFFSLPTRSLESAKQIKVKAVSQAGDDLHIISVLQ